MLTPAPKPDVPIDRRACDRIPVDHQLVLQFGADASWLETDASLVDLSFEGMFVRCDRVPKPSQRAFLVIRHPLLGNCLAAGAPIRFIDGGFGVRFHRTNDVMKDAIVTLSHLRQNPHPNDRFLGDASELRVHITDD